MTFPKMTRIARYRHGALGASDHSGRYHEPGLARHWSTIDCSMTAKHLLIVAHAPSPNTEAMRDAVLRGARDEDIDGVEVRAVAPLAAVADDVLWAHAIILGTSENFGYMSGALKDFFDRIYYPCLERTPGLPYAMYIRAGNDGTGARRSIERIVGGLRWRSVHEPVMCVGPFAPSCCQACHTLGMTIAAGLEAEIFGLRH